MGNTVLCAGLIANAKRDFIYPNDNKKRRSEQVQYKYIIRFEKCLCNYEDIHNKLPQKFIYIQNEEYSDAIAVKTFLFA